MEESTVRNSRISETRERTVSRERKRTGSTKSVHIGRIQEEQETESAVDMMWKQRGYGERQRQNKTTTGVLLREQRHSKGFARIQKDGNRKYNLK